MIKMKILGAVSFLLFMLVAAYEILQLTKDHFRVTVTNNSQFQAVGGALVEEVTRRSVAIGTLRPGESRTIVWHPHEEISTYLKFSDLGGKPASENVIPYPEGECATVSITIQPSLKLALKTDVVSDLWCWKWE